MLTNLWPVCKLHFLTHRRQMCHPLGLQQHTVSGNLV